MKYRFTAEDFFDEYTRAGPPRGIAQLAAARANAKLEQWEKESEHLYGYEDRDFGTFVYFTDQDASTDYSHEAILWNPKEIGDK